MAGSNEMKRGSGAEGWKEKELIGEEGTEGRLDSRLLVFGAGAGFVPECLGLEPLLFAGYSSPN